MRGFTMMRMMKMKKMIGLVLLLLAIFCAACGLAFADSGTCGDNLTWTLSNGVLTISGTGAMTSYTENNGAPWRDLDFQEAVIEDGVTSIGEYAFRGCGSLEKVTIPQSVTIIDDLAFESCFALTDISIPDGVTYLGTFAFGYCESLTEISIPGSVTQTGDSVFLYCPELSQVSISPEIDVNAFGRRIFFNCTSLMDAEKFIQIGSFLFGYEGNATTIDIPEGVTHIINAAIMGNTNIVNVSLPEGLYYIGNQAFRDCRNLEHINIPYSVGYIADNAFENDNKFSKPSEFAVDPDSHMLIRYRGTKTEITADMLSGITAIGSGAFSGCGYRGYHCRI